MSTNRSIRQVTGIVSLFALSSFTLFGCGSGDSSVAATPTRAVVASTPSNIEEAGGTATYTLDINQAVSVDPSTVLINVEKGNFPGPPFPIPAAAFDPTTALYQSKVITAIQDKTNVSLTGGPQVMTPVPGVKNRFTYQFTFPAFPDPNFGFTAFYAAKDTHGNPIKIAVTAGTNENRNVVLPAGTLTLPFTPFTLTGSK